MRGRLDAPEPDRLPESGEGPYDDCIERASRQLASDVPVIDATLAEVLAAALDPGRATELPSSRSFLDALPEWVLDPPWARLRRTGE